jgi:hypothetical protein
MNFFPKYFPKYRMTKLLNFFKLSAIDYGSVILLILTRILFYEILITIKNRKSIMPFSTFRQVMLSIMGEGDCLRRTRPAIAELGSSFRFAPFGMTVCCCIGGRRERSLRRTLSSSCHPPKDPVIPSGARNLPGSFRYIPTNIFSR